MHPFRRFSIALVLILSSCSGSPPPDLYLLDVGSAGPKDTMPWYERIGMEKVRLPAYAQSDRIASLRSDHIVVQDDDNRWAEPPEEALSRVLALSLGRQLGGDVVVEPFPRGFDPDLRVQIRFDRFLRNGEGASEIAGQVTLLSGDGRSVLDIERFDVVTGASDLRYAAYVEAVSLAVDTLSERITASAISLSGPAVSNRQ